MVDEMQRLRERLIEMDVDWWDESDKYIDRTLFEHNGKRWSAINGYGTYGGYNRGEHNRGLLEIWDGIDYNVGFLTADDAIQIIFEGEQ